ncbi:MAG: YbgC/FadM family acyl-CoA thioesterase [Alphaproteobacteria bacterium]|nr:YbgC/FadM family acyl-CoA thioesterase [Alphaproteobacteria bacterium]MCZ6763942.1 YbgC/FadM family acyl-CoA thioesterase [Alphaproteobacteria bacterium]
MNAEAVPALEEIDGSALPGRIEDDCHLLLLRVYYQDTDAAGLVYHANYLKFAERARTEALYAVGWGQARLDEKDRIVFIVRRCEADFLVPARLGDIVLVRSRVTDIGGARLNMEQTISLDGQDLTRLSVELVCVNRDGRPTRVPQPLASALSVGIAAA